MSIPRLPPLNAVRAFEAAARLGSYVAAAKALHVTQPAVGRHPSACNSVPVAAPASHPFSRILCPRAGRR